MVDNYTKLLSWHASHTQSKGYFALPEAILRSGSRALHDLLAIIATHNQYTMNGLRAKFVDNTLETIEYRKVWFAALGYVVSIHALQQSDEDQRLEELEFGMGCLQAANQKLPKDQEHQHFHRLEIELLLEQGRFDEARRLVQTNESLRDLFYGYLFSDSINPAVTGQPDTTGLWLREFNRPFSENNLSPVRFSSNRDFQFNAIETEQLSPVHRAPKVSVILTSYCPKREELLLAANSILSQTWSNLELIVVDDASPEEYSQILKEVEKLDERVRLVRLANNRGTYGARNVGIRAAAGDYITGQDSDDWSHPQRLETQVNYLVENPTAPGIMIQSIRLDNDLVRAFPGTTPYRNCEVSFMLSAEKARESGGYVRARKGADTEFRLRIDKLSGKPTETIKKPLYLTRIGHDSLSNADFKPGWSHAVRQTFRNSFDFWHEYSPISELRLGENSLEPFPVPQRFQVESPAQPVYYDAVFASDWRTYGSSQRAIIDEIQGLRSKGYSVGILHMESILSSTRKTIKLSNEIQWMLNEGQIHRVLPDESAETGLLFFRDPTILQFMPTDGVNLSSRVTVVNPDIPPPTGQTVMYLPELCDSNARSVFDSEVLWSSNDAAIHRLLKTYSSKINVDSKPVPIVFELLHWANNRPNMPDSHPRIGRHAENYREHWPDDQRTSLDLWPSDSSSEIRILGDARAFLRKFEITRFPSDWVVYRDQDIRPEAFMSGLDFFVYFPAENYPETYSREALEAAAAGALVILPHQFTAGHGETAVYASPNEVPNLINEYQTHLGLYNKHVNKISEVLATNDFQQDFLQYIEHLESKYSLPLRSQTEFNA